MTPPDSVVRSPEPLAQVEPDNDYYRRQLRSMVVMIEKAQDEGRLTTDLAALKVIAKECLARPRSNDAAIDRLEREVGDLRTKLIDMDVLRTESGQAHAVAAQMTTRAELAEQELKRLRASLGRRFGRAGQILDGWIAKRKKR